MNLLDQVARYFDLRPAVRKKNAVPPPEGGEPRAPVLPQYFALVAGIIAEPLLRGYVASRTLTLPTDRWGWIVAGILIGLVMFPGVYRRVFDPDRPIFVQLCTIFVSGLGWQTLVSTALSTTT